MDRYLLTKFSHKLDMEISLRQMCMLVALIEFECDINRCILPLALVYKFIIDQNNKGGMVARIEGETKSSILILDDDFDILTIMKLGLQDSSFAVFGFTDPALALEHFGMNANYYHLVISDVRMPTMNGFEFIKKVKEIKPEIKVFLMTAFEVNDIEFKRVLASTKIDEYIQKPVPLERLNTLVRNHIVIGNPRK
jgi:response regulator RpfG family c-di-GMP phosphodiesterase